MAEHVKLQSYRAIKRIKKDSCFHEQLMNEAKILKSLKHPNIPVIYDIEDDNEYSYIIEEFLEGQSLKALRLYQSNIREELILNYAIQICDLFLYIHALKTPILYLDLKPDNILVYDNILKLVDFGTAVYTKDAKDRMFSFGTKGYAAPEQYGIQKVDERSDIYGIGVLLFFLVTQETYSINNVTLSLLDGIHYCSDELKEIIYKCLKYSPSQRFQNVTQLRKKLITLQDKTVYNRSVKSKQSLVIAIAGSQNRIGTTHIGFLITSYFNQFIDKALYIENNDNFVVSEILNRYHAMKDKSDIVYINHCAMFHGISFKEIMELKNYRFKIIDFGILNKENMDEFQKADIKLFVLGIKEWELKYANQCLKELLEYHDIYYLFNFTGGKEFIEAVNNMEKENCIRVPYHPNPFSVDNQGMVKDFIDEFFKEKGYEKKASSIKGNLLFKRRK